jgi:hypothetical protein
MQQEKHAPAIPLREDVLRSETQGINGGGFGLEARLLEGTGDGMVQTTRGADC